MLKLSHVILYVAVHVKFMMSDIIPLCIMEPEMPRPSSIARGHRIHKGFRMAAVPEGELFTLKEVATWAKVTVSTVRAMIHRGELPAIKLGRLWRVRREDLDAFMARQRHHTEDALC